MGTELDEAMLALRDGRSTGDKFLRATGPRWRKIARDLHHRWRKKLPAWVEVEDIEQELVLQVFEHIGEFDPARGMTIGGFVVWAATHRTQREIHKMRGARLHGNEGQNPGRPEKTFSNIRGQRGDDGERMEFDPTSLFPAKAQQFEDASVEQVLSDAIQRAQTVRDVLILYALRESGGEPDEAACRIFESFSARVQCGVLDAGHARSLVRKAILTVAAQLGSAA